MLPKLVAMDPVTNESDISGALATFEKREFFYRGRDQKTDLPLYVEESKPLPTATKHKTPRIAKRKLEV